MYWSLSLLHVLSNLTQRQLIVHSSFLKLYYQGFHSECTQEVTKSFFLFWQVLLHVCFYIVLLGTHCLPCLTDRCQEHRSTSKWKASHLGSVSVHHNRAVKMLHLHPLAGFFVHLAAFEGCGLCRIPCWQKAVGRVVAP